MVGLYCDNRTQDETNKSSVRVIAKTEILRSVLKFAAVEIGRFSQASNSNLIKNWTEDKTKYFHTLFIANFDNLEFS